MTSATYDDDCYNCRINAQPDRPPLPGWLVLAPTTHVTAIADLDSETAAELVPCSAT